MPGVTIRNGTPETTRIFICSCSSVPDVLVLGGSRPFGSPADTPIDNTAQATFNDPDGNPQTVISNTISLRVDEVLNVTS